MLLNLAPMLPGGEGRDSAMADHKDSTLRPYATMTG